MSIFTLLYYCRPPITPSQFDGSVDAEKSASESSQQGTEAVAASAEFSAADKKKTTEEEKERPTSGRENGKKIGENSSLSFNCIWHQVQLHREWLFSLLSKTVAWVKRTLFVVFKRKRVVGLGNSKFNQN